MSISVPLSDDLVEQIAHRAAELLRDEHAPTGPDPWMTVDDAAAYLACRRQRIYNLVSQRRVQFAKEGGRVLFRRQWLDDLTENS